jgi:hypothetical protein
MIGKLGTITEMDHTPTSKAMCKVAINMDKTIKGSSFNYTVNVLVYGDWLIKQVKSIPEGKMVFVYGEQSFKDATNYVFVKEIFPLSDEMQKPANQKQFEEDIMF